MIPTFLSKQINPLLQSLHHRRSSKLKITPLFVVLTLTLLCLLQSATYKLPQGLPNFDAILFAEHFSDVSTQVYQSQVYQWIQKNIQDQTIYTIALRPYGLYNFPFSNRVIYGGDSEQWTYQNALDVIATNSPDYLAIGRNPFNGQFPIAFVDLLEDTQRFEVVYGDSLAVVFQVKS